MIQCEKLFPNCNVTVSHLSVYTIRIYATQITNKFSPSGNPLDLVFVVDNSAQIAENSPAQLGPNWNQIRTFLIYIIENLIPDGPLGGTRVGMILYSAAAENVFYLNRCVTFSCNTVSMLYMKTKNTLIHA